MKLRMLNGAHSTLAYLGAVAGIETVARQAAIRSSSPCSGASGAR